MFYGRGRGFGTGGGGWGYGFRGFSPPWPFVGRGRGGLPRCGYFYGGLDWTPADWAYSLFPPGYDVPQDIYPIPASQASLEQELVSLKNEARSIKAQLGQIETRMNILTGKEENKNN